MRKRHLQHLLKMTPNDDLSQVGLLVSTQKTQSKFVANLVIITLVVKSPPQQCRSNIIKVPPNHFNDFIVRAIELPKKT